MAGVVTADEPGAASRTIDVLSAGGVVVLPTDTVYGLAAVAADASATATLFARKGREADVPIAVLCASSDQALELAADVPDAAARLTSEHWPGPLTIVLRRRADLHWALGEPHDTIGLRCPDHALVQELAAAVGPLATTSANRHGAPTPRDAAAAAAGLRGSVDLVVDGGPLHGSPSTVVDATTDPISILRRGALDLDVR